MRIAKMIAVPTLCALTAAACCQVHTAHLCRALQGWLKKLRLHRIHDGLSKVTEKRKACMPWDGTFDFWVLLSVTAMNLFAVVFGIFRLQARFWFTVCL